MVILFTSLAESQMEWELEPSWKLIQLSGRNGRSILDILFHLIPNAQGLIRATQITFTQFIYIL